MKKLTVVALIIFLSACHIPQLDRFDPVATELSGKGVQARTTVARDRHGIAHIRAENQDDLFFAVDHMMARIRSGEDPVEAAEEYCDSIIEKCRRIGVHGEPLIKDGAKIMTHCNAGALATIDHGTALAPIREAHRKGKKVFVYVSETRPRLQGMKLTAFELLNEGIPHAIISDGASGHFMRKDVDIIIVGADRIAANGDFANKIGTFEKAVLAKELGIPFYTAAPISTFDFSISSGKEIPIEDRAESEVTEIGGVRVAPIGSPALNPSFDMTPHRYLTGIITEMGVLSPQDVIKVKEEGMR